MAVTAEYHQFEEGIRWVIAKWSTGREVATGTAWTYDQAQDQIEETMEAYTLADAAAEFRLSEWRRITINGKPYRTHPDNVPAGTQVGDEFRLRWRVGYVWARLIT